MKSLILGFFIVLLSGCEDGFETSSSESLANSDGSSDSTASTLCTPNSQQICQAGNGTGSQTCNSSGSAWSTCGNLVSCNSGYNLQNGACVPNVVATLCTPNSQQPCQAGNGTGSKICNSSGSAWGVCGNLVSCNSGYNLQNGACVANAASCVFGNRTIAHGENIVAYTSSSVSFGQACMSEIRNCNNGVLSGSAAFGSCTVGAGSSCVHNGQTVAHGETLRLYSSAVSDAKGMCFVEDRLCSNGILSGSAQYSSCIPVGLHGKQLWQNSAFNANTLQQDPDDESLFWGREFYYSASPGEDASDHRTWKRLTVTLYRADFVNRRFTKIRNFLDRTSTTSEGRVVYTSYDPAVIKIGDTKYVVFECHGPGFPGSAAICGGPVTADNQMRMDKFRVYVYGINSAGGPLSASVPKFTNINGRVLLGWSQVEFYYGLGDIKDFKQINTRAVDFYPTMPDIYSDAPVAYNIYNPPERGTADLFSALWLNAKVYFAGGRGPTGCTWPLLEIAGCYRLEVGAVTELAADGALDGVAQAPVTLPDNPMEYSRWMHIPGQGWGVIAGFLNKWDGNTSATVAPGLYFLPMSNGDNFVNFSVKTVASTCDPNNQPFPHWGKRNGECLRSCGGLGGTHAFSTACSLNGMTDVGRAYDTPYCCANR